MRQANHPAKVVVEFVLLMQWNHTNYKGGVVVKVYLKDDAKIPHAVTLTIGTSPKVKSFSFQVYCLCKKDVTPLQDEDPLPKEGPIHPLPYEAPCWMGPV